MGSDRLVWLSWTSLAGRRRFSRPSIPAPSGNPPLVWRSSTEPGQVVRPTQFGKCTPTPRPWTVRHEIPLNEAAAKDGPRISNTTGQACSRGGCGGSPDAAEVLAICRSKQPWSGECPVFPTERCIAPRVHPACLVQTGETCTIHGQPRNAVNPAEQRGRSTRWLLAGTYVSCQDWARGVGA
jgi:hypothetical protein